MKPHQELAEDILELSDPQNTIDSAMLDTLADSYPDGGFLTYGSMYWVPATNIEQAVSSLAFKIGDYHEATKAFADFLLVTIDQLREAIEADNLSFSYFRRTFGIEPQAKAHLVPLRDHPSIHEELQVAHSRGDRRPRQEKWAVLICFEGGEAKNAAERYLEVFKDAVETGLTSTYTPMKLAQRYHARICCIELHDCQKHPLKG